MMNRHLRDGEVEAGPTEHERGRRRAREVDRVSRPLSDGEQSRESSSERGWRRCTDEESGDATFEDSGDESEGCEEREKREREEKGVREGRERRERERREGKRGEERARRDGANRGRREKE